jgi:hypothetical protein
MVEAIAGLLFALDYIVRVVVPRGDVWEELGPHGVLLRLLADAALISLVVVAVLISHDSRRGSIGRPSSRWWRGYIGRQKDALAGSEPIILPEKVAVQIADLPAAAFVAEPVPRDAAEGVVGLDHVNGVAASVGGVPLIEIVRGNGLD